VTDEVRQADTLSVLVNVTDVVALRHRDALGDIVDVEVAHRDGDDVAQRDGDTLTHAVELGDDVSVPLIDALTLPLEDTDGDALAVELRHSVAVGDMDAVAVAHRDIVADVVPLGDAVKVTLNEPLNMNLPLLLKDSWVDTIALCLSTAVSAVIPTSPGSSTFTSGTSPLEASKPNNKVSVALGSMVMVRPEPEPKAAVFSSSSFTWAANTMAEVV
jgi:hypothetical protein